MDNGRIRKYRELLNISQEYVAKYLNINRSSLSQLETGNRKLTADEAIKLSKLFGISTDELLLEKQNKSEAISVFARKFDTLDDNDKAEIMNLIEFKERMKSKK